MKNRERGEKASIHLFEAPSIYFVFIKLIAVTDLTIFEDYLLHVTRLFN